MLRVFSALTAIFLVSLPCAAETRDRTVKANTRTAIGGFLGYEVDTCYPSMIPVVKVRQAPSNGSIDIIPHQEALTAKDQCPGLKVRGLAYIYTPKKGFKGSDELSIDVPWRSTDSGPETLMTYTFRIRVE
jgi:hypothetical protein